MSITVHQQIVALLRSNSVSFEEYHHQACASSEESARTRKEAGAGDTVGAKALLVKSKKGIYSVCAIPGHNRLDSKIIRQLIGKHSFATTPEMEAVTSGLQPGHMPPFGPQIFSGIANLIVDSNLQDLERIGFNAGDPTISIVLKGRDYLRACGEIHVIHPIISAS